MTCSIKTYFTVVLSLTSSVNKVIHSNHFLCILPFIPHFSCLLIFSYGVFTRLHCFTTQGFHTTSIHKLNDSTFRLGYFHTWVDSWQLQLLDSEQMTLLGFKQAFYLSCRLNIKKTNEHTHKNSSTVTGNLFSTISFFVVLDSYDDQQMKNWTV